jgi:mono/diheme cytochrome c family protein
MKRTAILLAGLALAVGAPACGNDDDGNGTDTTTTETETETTTTETAGREVFIANCGTCHTLSDAGTTGTTGPALDGTTRSRDEIEEQVRNGGGAMPAFEDTLEDDDIEAVADYVDEASG